MDASKLQHELFQVIKANIPASLSVTEEIAKVLDVSVDSVYRRMRGEKTISLDELYTLCTHYKISLDSILNIQTGAFSFQGNLIDNSSFRFAEYLSSILKWMTYFNSFKQKELYYMCKDIPLFQHFHFRELAAFKYYFWMKTIFYFPDFTSRKFSFREYPDEVFALGQKNLDIYNQLSITEFWNVEGINSTLRQIEFYRDGDMFESDEDVLKIYIAVEKLLDHLEAQAALGYKYNYNDPEKKPLGSYQMYFNEVILGDNNQLLVLDGLKLSLITHTVINYMITRDLAFNEKMYNHVQNMMKKSTRISSVSEKERTKFFHALHERIARRKDSLKL
ncbi:MAG: helix-turn-helix domain-containing protein [Chitinophagales bacterium]